MKRRTHKRKHIDLKSANYEKLRNALKKQEKVKKNTKQLKELIADINLNEISSQIQADNLSAWLHIITKEMNKLVEELE